MAVSLDELSVKFALDASQKAYLRARSFDLVALSERLAAGEPFDYVVGTSCFMGYELTVDRRVLIPRHETELLVEEAEAFIAGRALHVLDLCTGSGAIAVALKKRNPRCIVHAGDISSDALSLARGNAVRLGVDVTFIESDLFARIEGVYDLIVSNPPYVATAYVDTHCAASYEPRLALDGGEQGMDVIERLLAQATKHLANGGVLMLEMGYDQEATVKACAAACGLHTVKTVHDYNGHARHIVLRKK
jgi:release factor glutamine methyltransferase